MKIGIDAKYIYTNKAGTGRYINNLLSHVKKIDNVNLYVELHPSSQSEIKKTNNFLSRITNGFGEFIRCQLMLPLRTKSLGIDILHSPTFISPIITGCPVILTIYDLNHILYPETFEPLYRQYLNLLLPICAKRATKIITTSESSRKDIIGNLHVGEDKVEVIYGAASPIFGRLDTENNFQSVLKKFRIRTPYILNVGTLEPRKNISGLLKAFSMLKERKSIPHKLVIVGEKGWRHKIIFKAISSLNLQDEVIFTSYISDEELMILYNKCNVFVYPSLYEGFGLPPLEAMTCGAPVITSNTSSLPEVVGNAGIMINPDNTEELCETIYTVIENNSLMENMRKKSLERAKLFSWEKSARQLLKIYSEV